MRLWLNAVIALLSSYLLPLNDVFSKEVSLDEKIGQMLMVHFNGETVNSTAESLILEEHVGGFILFNWSNGLSSPEQVKNLTEGLQNIAGRTEVGLPLLIALDQEGGFVNRLTDGFTHFPGNRAVAMTGNTSFANRCAYAMSLEQLSVGINMTLAPVIDIAAKGSRSIIGIRSYGDDPKVVTDYGAEALAGYRDAGMISTLKHYPNLGNASVDPHYDCPVNGSEIEDFYHFDLSPYLALANSADAIMTGHVIVKAIDPDNCVTLSRRMLNILRQEHGFDGVIMSDSLVMDAILHTCTSIEEAAVRAIEAGCDLLLLGGKLLNENTGSLEVGCDKIRSIRHAVCDAVNEGRISSTQIDQSVERIRKLKSKIPANCEIPEISASKNMKLADEIAALSARTRVQNHQSLDQLKYEKVQIIAPSITRNSMNKIITEVFDHRATLHYYNSSQHMSDLVELTDTLPEDTGTVIFFSYNAWKSPKQKNLLETFHSSGQPLVLIALADEEDLQIFPDLPFAVATYSPSPASIRNALNQLITPEKWLP